MSHIPPASIGLIGFGAFGRLIARCLKRDFQVYVYDPAFSAGRAEAHGIKFSSLSVAASRPIVVLAVPVQELERTVQAIRAHLRPGSVVLDVGSVKVIPAEIMRRELPDNVAIIATHPLFGPQSAADGVRGLKIAICPIRGSVGRRAAAYLRRRLGLKVIFTTPNEHDREAAIAQGLTHLIAKVLAQMEPLPKRMTTRSFDLLVQSMNMVRHDAPEVFQAIEQSNPYSADVRRRFFDLASMLDASLAGDTSKLAPATLAPEDAMMATRMESRS
jgi:prephenate dehydrogenase